MNKYLIIILILITLRVYLPNGTVQYLECERVDIAHTGLNVRSMFNHFSNIGILEVESEEFIIDLNRDKITED